MTHQNTEINLLSTKMAESLALVGLEAMSFDVTVICTNDFTIKDYVIRGESEERFQKADFNSFYDAIVKVIKNIDNDYPRDIVLKDYSQKYVVNQYREYMGVEDE